MISQKYIEQLKSRAYPKRPKEPFEKDFATVGEYATAKTQWLKDMETWRQNTKAYNDNENKIISDFSVELLKELGIADHPKAGILWSMAWERGHAWGLESVEQEAEELSELLK